MAPQNTRKHSPKAQPRQIQNMSTPLRTEYAGPAFHHSPAPSSLPPPPFLAMAKSRSQQKENVSFETGSSALAHESSPLGFLFDAKDREASFAQLKKEQPPTLGFSYASTEEQNLTLAQQSRLIPRFADLHDMSQSQAAQKSAITSQAVRPTAAGNTSKAAEPATTKTSPWAPIDRPKAITLDTPAVSEMKVANNGKSRERPRTPLARETRENTSTSSPRTAQLRVGGKSMDKKPSSDSLRKKRTPKKTASNNQQPGSSAKTEAKVVPKTILKRPVPTESTAEIPRSATPAATPQAQSKKSSPSREASASSFQPLEKRKPSPLPARARTTAHSAQPTRILSPLTSQSQGQPQSLESEVDLRRQTAHLMSILNIKSPSPRDTSPIRHFSPATPTHEKTSASSPSAVESDLRRLLRLGA